MVRRFDRTALLWGAVIGLGLGWLGCTQKPDPKPDPDLLARVGEREIRAAEFQESMRRRAVSDDPAQKLALLEELIDTAALVEKAKAEGLDRDPEVRRIWENLLVSKLRERQIETEIGRAVATPEEVQAEYETNRASFTEPAMRRGAVLFLETPAKTSPSEVTRQGERIREARSKALQQLASEPAARGFGSLAVEYSDDQTTRYRGGDLGWIPAGRSDARVDPVVMEALFALPGTNTVSEPIQTSRGFWLVKLLEIRPERIKPLASVRAALEQQVRIRNSRRIEADWKRAARSQVRVEVFTNVLDQIRRAQPAEPTSEEPPRNP